MSDSSERLGKHVSKLISSKNMSQFDEAFYQFMPDKMTIYFNVLCAFMKNRILDNVNGSKIVTLDWYGGNRSEGELMK